MIKSPELNISKESPPRRLLVVTVQKSYLLTPQGSPTSSAISRFRIPPRRSKNDLIPDCKDDNNQESNDVLEEILCCESRAALITNH
jgi:hypothetical protein